MSKHPGADAVAPLPCGVQWGLAAIATLTDIGDGKVAHTALRGNEDGTMQAVGQL